MSEAQSTEIRSGITLSSFISSTHCWSLWTRRHESPEECLGGKKRREEGAVNMSWGVGLRRWHPWGTQRGQAVLVIKESSIKPCPGSWLHPSCCEGVSVWVVVGLTAIFAYDYNPYNGHTFSQRHCWANNISNISIDNCRSHFNLETLFIFTARNRLKPKTSFFLSTWTDESVIHFLSNCSEGLWWATKPSGNRLLIFSSSVK